MAIALCISAVAYAQGGGKVTVSGTVTDASNLPIIGASVTIDGTDQGVMTDIDGKYSIDAASTDVLTFSYIGYVSQSVAVGARTTIDVQLAEDTQALDEVVVTGYATQAKKDITGSVAVVSRDAIAEQPVSSFAEALQGRAAGVTITNAGGPAGDSQIRVRGVGSVNGSDPLIIVDGVQGVNISSVNPNDIETMQVLKDAAATAIYGARGANGVVVITTKQGGKKGGKATVNFDAYVGFKKIAKTLDVLTPYEYVKLDYERSLYKFEAGTPNYVGSYAFSKAIDYVQAIGLEDVAKYEHELAVYLEEQLVLLSNVRVYAAGQEKAGAVSFNVYREDGALIHPFDVGVLLDRQGVAVRTGHHCAEPLIDYLGVPGTVRASVGLYNTKEDVDVFVAALKKAIMMLE